MNSNPVEVVRSNERGKETDVNCARLGDNFMGPGIRCTASG